jgi:Lipocalin-like domain
MRKLLVACAALAMLGCGGDSTGPSASAVGTWNLQTVNGSGLPYTVIFVASPVYRFEILSDEVVVNADGTYTETSSVRETDGTTVTTSTEQDDGTWTQHGNQIDVTSNADGSVNTAVISGDKLTLAAQGISAVYVRQ